MSIHATRSSFRWSSRQLHHVMPNDAPDSSSCRPLCIYFLGGSLVLLSLVLHLWWIPLSMGPHFLASIGFSLLFALVDHLGLDPLDAPLDYSSPLALSWKWSHHAIGANAPYRAPCAPIYGDFLHHCTSNNRAVWWNFMVIVIHSGDWTVAIAYKPWALRVVRSKSLFELQR